MMSDEPGAWRDTEEQAAMVLGALRCLTDLVTSQARGCEVSSEKLGCLLTLLTDETEKVLPLEKCSPHGRPDNDD